MENEEVVEELAVTKVIPLQDKDIELQITPVREFVESLKTDTPYIVLFSGLIISLLLALTVRYVMISRVKSEYLARSNRLNQGILSSASYMIIAADKTGKVVLFNKAAEKNLGYKAEELLGKMTPEIWHDLGEVEERAEELTQELGCPVMPGFEVFTAKPSIEGHETREWTFIDRAKRRFPVSLTVTPLWDTKENITGYLGIAEDITQRREMEQMKSEFISIVSHELRTPLTSIRGSLGLIEGAMFRDIPEKAMNLIKIAHKNSERLILLINDILDLDKIAAGKMRFNLKPEDTASLVYIGIEINAAYAENYSVKFVGTDIPNDLMVNVDADRWQQVFANLLSNAAKFSPKGSEVIVSAEALGKMIRVSVQDKGPGISPEFQDRIFSKFSQADFALTRQKGGTGLGLNISKEIVTRMGGKIGFDTKMGEGTTFWFEFPDIRYAVTDTDADLSGIAKEDEAGQKNLPSILHLEDDEGFCEMLVAAINDNANVVCVSTLSMAKSVLTTRSFSLVIIDIGLPDGSGLSLIDYMEDKGIDVPIVILSADEVPSGLYDNVVASIVKSKTPENKIVESILSYLPKKES